MEKTLEFTQYGGGRYACTFTAAGGKSLIQVIRQKQGLIYIEAGADTEHLTYLESAGRFKDVLCEIEVPAETVVRVVSHTPVKYAAYMAGEEGKSGDYYTKAEVDELIVGIHQFEPVVTSSLQTASADTMYKLYFVPKGGGGETGNTSDEYITVRSGEEGSYTYAWERIGDTTIDLSGYATLAYVDGKFIPIPDPLPALPANADGALIENIVQDYDGNWYDGVVIGNQIWLKQNLRTTHYADGTAIPNGGSQTSNSDPYYYDYAASEIPFAQRGYLYNWPAVMHGEESGDANQSGVQGIAPTGWHVPSDEEWMTMEATQTSMDVSGYGMRGDHAGKLAGDGWSSSSTAGSPGNATDANHNASGFSAVPAGSYDNAYGMSGTYAFFWSSTSYYNESAVGYDLVTFFATVQRQNYGIGQGFSVRCVCDLTASEWFAANGGSRYLKNTPQGLVWAKLAAVAETGSYNDLKNKPSEQLLPAVTSSDNGKTLLVDNGTWQKGEPRDNRIPAITPAIGGSNSDDWTKIMAVNPAGNGFELVYPREAIVWQSHHYGGGEVQIDFKKRYQNTCIFTSEEEDFSLNIRFDTTADCYLFIKNRANHKIHFTVNRIQYGSYIDVPLKKVTEGVLENGVDIEAGGFCLIRAKMVVDMAIIDVMNQPVANPNFTHTANTTVSDPTANITFPAYRRCTQMITVSADLGVTIEVNNLSDNYLWIKNNSNSDVDITITAVTHGGNSVSNIYMPADGIIVPANGVCEIGILVNTDGAFISSRNDLTLQQ